MKMRADDEEKRSRERRRREEMREWSPYGDRSTPPAYFTDWDAPGAEFTGWEYTVDEDFDYNEAFLRDDDREEERRLPNWEEKKKEKWRPPADLKRMKVTVENKV